MKDTARIFVADTYAIMEIAKGNRRYRQYLPHIFVTSIFQLVELHYKLSEENGKAVADKYIQVYATTMVPLSLSCIRRATLFKHRYKKEKMSYADAIGWALAEELGVKFLTGDSKFQDKDHVEFMK